MSPIYENKVTFDIRVCLAKLWNCFGDRLHTIQDGGAPSNEGNPDYAEVDSSGALLISNGKVQVSGTQQGPYATTTLVDPPPFSQVRKH